MEFNEQITSIIERFDFQAVVAYIETMKQPPFQQTIPENMESAEEVKKIAETMLMNASKMDNDTILEKNGLEVERIQKHLELRYVPLKTNTLSIMHE